MTMDDATWHVVVLDSPADLRTPIGLPDVATVEPGEVYIDELGRGWRAGETWVGVRLVEANYLDFLRFEADEHARAQRWKPRAAWASLLATMLGWTVTIQVARTAADGADSAVLYVLAIFVAGIAAVAGWHIAMAAQVGAWRRRVREHFGTPGADVCDEPRRPLLSGPALDDAEPIDEPTAAEVQRRRRRPILYARAADD